MISQVPLSFGLIETSTFECFSVGKNTETFAFLNNFLQQQAQRFLYLWGNEGVGKSHLIQALCHQAQGLEKSVFFLPLQELAETGPAILIGHESFDAYLIDDLDKVAGDPEWEAALFALYNERLDQKLHFAISASKGPKQVGISLPDLASRMLSGLVSHIEELADEEKMLLLQARALLLGLEFPRESIEYLFNRSSRSLTQLILGLSKLDKASMAAQRKLTIPFVKEVLLLK